MTKKLKRNCCICWGALYKWLFFPTGCCVGLCPFMGGSGVCSPQICSIWL